MPARRGKYAYKKTGGYRYKRPRKKKRYTVALKRKRMRKGYSRRFKKRTKKKKRSIQAWQTLGDPKSGIFNVKNRDSMASSASYVYVRQTMLMNTVSTPTADGSERNLLQHSVGTRVIPANSPFNLKNIRMTLDQTESPLDSEHGFVMFDGSDAILNPLAFPNIQYRSNPLGFDKLPSMFKYYTCVKSTVTIRTAPLTFSSQQALDDNFSGSGNYYMAVLVRPIESVKKVQLYNGVMPIVAANPGFQPQSISAAVHMPATIDEWKNNKYATIKKLDFNSLKKGATIKASWSIKCDRDLSKGQYLKDPSYTCAYPFISRRTIVNAAGTGLGSGHHVDDYNDPRKFWSFIFVVMREFPRPVAGGGVQANRDVFVDYEVRQNWNIVSYGKRDFEPNQRIDVTDDTLDFKQTQLVPGGPAGSALHVTGTHGLNDGAADTLEPRVRALQDQNQAGVPQPINLGDDILPNS